MTQPDRLRGDSHDALVGDTIAVVEDYLRLWTALHPFPCRLAGQRRPVGMPVDRQPAGPPAR